MSHVKKPSTAALWALGTLLVLVGAVLAGALGRPAPLVAASPTPTPVPSPTPTPPLSGYYQCRHAAEFHVRPDAALVYVNGQLIGPADDWDDRGGGKAYQFRSPGNYWVRFSLPGYETTWVKIHVSLDAEKPVAKVKLKLPRRR